MPPAVLPPVTTPLIDVTDLDSTVGETLAPVVGPINGNVGLLDPITGPGGLLGPVTGSGGLVPLGP